MKHITKITIALMSTLIASTAHAWQKHESTDAFSGKDQSYHYVEGKAIQYIGDSKDFVKQPELHYYDKAGVYGNLWYLVPGDGHICQSQYGINMQIKIDGKVVKGEVKEERQFFMVSQVGFPFEHVPGVVDIYKTSLTSGIVDPIQHTIMEELMWLPDAIYNADNVIIKYVDGCGAGGVFEFDLTKKEIQ